MHVAKQERLKRRPRSLEAHPSWRYVADLCRLPTKLTHKIVSNHRRVEFFPEHVDALGSNVLGVQNDLQVANIKLHLNPMLIQFRKRIGILLQVGHQV